MAKVLSGRSGERANWAWERGIPEGKTKVTLSALQSAIREGFGRSDLADRLKAVGNVFGTAIKLREDSNYESLILAHQYFHSSETLGFINVQELFVKATAAMLNANQIVLQFVSDLLLASFKDDPPWYCPHAAFAASNLLELTLGYVRRKFVTWNAQQESKSLFEADWAAGLDGLEGRLAKLSQKEDPAVRSLLRYARFGEFEMKRGIMSEFRDKVDRLECVVRSLVENRR
jgi:hypothetical protein